MSVGSDRLESQLSIELDAITRSWFDGAAFGSQWRGEFTLPVSVEELLMPSSATFWPGFMPPDFLPILGNGIGDWLCLRIDRHNQVRDVVAWNHGGGDYLPFGRSIAEALLYDHLRHRPNFPSAPGQMDPTSERWLIEQLAMDPDTCRDFQRWSPSDKHDTLSATPRLDPEYQQRLEWMLAHGWARHAVRCERIEMLLYYPLWSFAAPRLAHKWQVDWNRDMVAWLFDSSLLPSPYRDRYEQTCLAQGLTTSAQEQPQDWDAILALALASIEEGCDSAWAFDLAGWSLMRRGDSEAAYDVWEQGCQASVFSDQSIRFRTHWCDPTIGKFSAAMLHRGGRVPARIAKDYWCALTSPTSIPSPVARVSSYWQTVAEQVTGWDGYRAWYAAGWDFGVPSRQLWPTILAQLQHCAIQGNAPALAKLAALHARTLAMG